MKNTDAVQAKMIHAAVDKMFKRVTDAGHTIQSIGTVSITKRFNGQTGNHVHATASVKLRFDESVSELDVQDVMPDYKGY